MENVAPYLKALVLCDLIIEDKFTNAKSFIGVRHELFAPKLPYNVAPFFAVGMFQGGQGEIPLSLNLTAPTGESLFHYRWDLTFGDKAETCEIVLEIRDLPVYHEGIYRIAFAVGKTQVGSIAIPLTVVSDVKVG